MDTPTPPLRHAHRLAPVALIIVIGLLSACNPPGPPRERVGRDCRVGLVGDSLMVGADTLGGLADRLAAGGCTLTRVDARTSLSSTGGAAVVEAWARAGQLPRILVVGLGTNDCSAVAVRRSAERILAAVGPNRPVVWVDIWRPGCDRATNETLVALRDELFSGRSDHGNLWLVDHHAWVAANHSVLARDRVHLTVDGYRRSAERIARTVVG